MPRVRERHVRQVLGIADQIRALCNSHCATNSKRAGCAANHTHFAGTMTRGFSGSAAFLAARDRYSDIYAFNHNGLQKGAVPQ